MSVKKNILQIKRNCWRISEIDKLSLLIDSQNYYKAFMEVGGRAKSSLHIAGWEIDGRMIINPTYPSTGLPLREYINKLSRNLINVYLLCWKAPFYLRFGRERFTSLKWKIKTNPKVQYRNNHSPFFFGSYHEKIAIFDRKCAFLGGIDLAKKRWDTPHHERQSQLRSDFNGESYNPIHDVQYVFTGKIIQDLETFIQKRVDINLFESQQSNQALNDLWPETFSPEVIATWGGLSRTVAESNILEIENLYIDAIRSAEEFILIENQYLSHRIIIEEIEKRLEENDGPEVIIILPFYYRGWSESAIYLSERNRAIKKLKSKDSGRKLRFLYPYIPSSDEDIFLVVHSKYMIIDNTFMTMGSANLNFRSMRVDSEINLSLEAQRNDGTKEFIESSLFRILAEHLDISSESFRRKFYQNYSLIKTIEVFQNTRPKTLKEIPIHRTTLMQKFLLFLYPFIDIRKAVPKEYAYWATGGILIFFLIAAKVMNGH